MGEVPLYFASSVLTAHISEGAVQGLLEIKDAHRPWDGPILLGTGLL